MSKLKAIAVLKVIAVVLMGANVAINIVSYVLKPRFENILCAILYFIGGFYWMIQINNSKKTNTGTRNVSGKEMKEEKNERPAIAKPFVRRCNYGLKIICQIFCTFSNTFKL